MAGISCFLATVTFEIAKSNCEETNLNSVWVISNLIFSFIGKCFITGSFGSVWVWTSELFPTKIRGSAVGISSTGARLATVFSPFLIGLQGLVSWLPGLVFGVVSILAGIVSLTLPETLGRPMLMSIEDALNLYKQT